MMTTKAMTAATMIFVWVRTGFLPGTCWSSWSGCWGMFIRERLLFSRSGDVVGGDGSPASSDRCGGVDGEKHGAE